MVAIGFFVALPLSYPPLPASRQSEDGMRFELITYALAWITDNKRPSPFYKGTQINLIMELICYYYTRPRGVADLHRSFFWQKR